jgi:hypothetical protein
MLRILVLIVAALGLQGFQCPGNGRLGTIRIAAGLDRPLFVSAPLGDKRLFIVEQGGVIKIWRDGAILPTPFLDISDLTEPNGEQGLLGLAFAPNYRASGHFYVNYTNLLGHTVIARFRVSSNPDLVQRPGQILLEVENTSERHKGGTVAFGTDGMLYVGLGDGHMSEMAQDDTSLLGKLLRIDVRGVFGSPYRIPPDNPFVGAGGLREEIFAKGFRNPYRFSVDPLSGRLYIADVGEGDREEIDVELIHEAGGRNYGWPRMEGKVCHQPQTNCNDGTLTRPVVDYDHSGGRCSVIGGYVTYGPVAALRGRYVFGDFCTGEIFSFVLLGKRVVTQLTNHTAAMRPDAGSIDLLSSFGLGGMGDLYIVDLDGEVFQVVER